MKTALGILTDARAFIARPNGWTKGASWRDANGDETKSAGEAVCCCSYGALSLWREGYSKEELIAVDYLEWASPQRNVIKFNDAPGTTQQDVIAMFDRAIERAKEPA